MKSLKGDYTMLNNFREELEDLLFRYAKKGIRLVEIDYKIEKDDEGEAVDLQNLKMIIEVK